MYTRCPECETVFRLSAEHLTQARGRVRCGCCGQAFDLSDRLYDEVPETETVTGNEGPIPVFGRAAAAPVTAPAPAASSPAQDVDESLHILMQSPRIDEDDDDRPALQKNLTRDEDDGESLPRLGDHDERRWLEDELLPLAQQKPRSHPWPWLVLTLLLMLLAALQFAWFEREQLVSRWPQLMAYYAPVCRYLPCATGTAADQRGEVIMLGHDVRNHPDVDQALLVNATLMNRGARVRPYPELQLQLFDRAGNIIGARRFQANEYLDRSIDISPGMLPNQPVHIVLEVVDVGSGAVSFEFQFL